MANNNKNKKYHFIYKTSCLFNSNYYIGMHSTSNILDGYMGSGVRINRAIKKYGVESFKCEILEYLADRDSLAEREKEIVTEELINDVNCLNLKPGGFGGWSTEQQKLNSIKSHAKQKLLSETDVNWKLQRSSNLTKALKSSYETGVRIKKNFCDWNGRKHSSSTIEQMSVSKKGKGLGKENSQFSSFWITNGTENKKVKHVSDIPNSWYKGRTIGRLPRIGIGAVC